MRAICSVFIFLLGFLNVAQSQQPSSDFRDQAYIVESAEDGVEFQNDGNYTRNAKLTVLIQADAGLQQWGSIRFGYAAEHNTMEVVAVTVTKPDGSIVKTDTSNLQDLPAAITQQMPFYSDLREKHAVVKGLNVGDRLTYEYTMRSTKPLIPGEFWFDYNFNDTVITQKESVTVVVPADRALKMRSIGGEPTVERAAGKVTYRWTRSNLKINPNAKEEGPDPNDVLSRSAPAEIELSTFTSWEQIGKWYAGLQAPAVQITPEIAAKAKHLTADKPDTAEKVKTLAAFVGTNVRYVGIEFGIGRYQPHAAAEVLANAYGDCKDKHTLLATMLQAIGIKAEPALISSKLALDRSVPTISAFDHVITAVEVAGKREFIDTTGEVYPYGYLPQPLRDKDVLLATMEPSLVRTPSMSPIPNAETFDIDATLSSEGVLTGKVKREVVGDSEILVRSVFRKVPPAQWKQVVQNMSAYSGFGGTVDSVKVTTPEDLQARFTVSYDYERKEYGGFKDGYTSPALPSMLLMNPMDLDKRKQPVVLTLGKMEATSRIKMPPGATLRAPEPKNLFEEFAEYHASYRFEDGVLYAKRSLVVKQLIVPPARFAVFRRFLQSVQDDRADQIALSVPGKNSDAAAALFEAGRSAYTRGDPQEGLRKFRQLVDKYPDYQGGWAMLGTGYAMLTEFDKAIDALQKEVDKHPDTSLMVYQQLAQLYAMKSRTKDATALWQKYLTTHPDDEQAMGFVGGLLVGEKRYSEALQLFQDAVAKSPENSRFHYGLGMSLLGMKQPDKAFESFKKCVELDGGARNDSAYALIEADVHLDEALDWSEHAVQQVEQNTAKIDLDDVREENLRSMQSLASFWDTLGWGYHGKGDDAKAEKFLKAAWTLAQSPVMGEHLSVVQRKLGRAAQADETKRLAEAGKPTAPFDPRKPAEAQRFMAGSAGRAKLSGMRDYPLSGLPKGVGGSVELYVLFTKANKPAEIKWLNVDPSRPQLTMSGGPHVEKYLKTAETIIKAKPFSNVHFPDDGPTRIIRRGILFCSSYSGCGLTLMPIESVRAVN
jgi:tetratricopeptide (TPR) repeat protein/transglutaminase-like putative cysteine protease